ncbi:hypothetical protein [Halocynthiibacter namhaensis]|uniref:AraC-like ligand-binding domain-containing protein n=1 Tax=Halocynthiibacter namhaensis TaxID=1290553 RepID=UPI000578FE2A|nr:hypothetical protein [Halocynthiibacter namhaensis]
MSETWTTTNYPKDLQFEAWKTMISSTAYELSFDKPETVGFNADHNAFHLNRLGLLHGTTDGFACERTMRDIRRSDVPFYALHGTTGGQQLIDYLGVSFELNPGDTYLWDSEHIGKLNVPKPINFFSVAIPKHILNANLPHQSDVKVGPTNPATKSLLYSAIKTTLSNANSFDKSETQVVEDVILSLTVAAFSHPKNDAQLTYQEAKTIFRAALKTQTCPLLRLHQRLGFLCVVCIWRFRKAVRLSGVISKMRVSNKPH